MTMIRQRMTAIVGSVLGAGALSACANDLRKPFDQSFCDEGQVRFLHDVEPREPADYVARRRSDYVGDPTLDVLESSGQCSTEVACQALEEIPPNEIGFQMGYDGGSEHIAVARDATTEFLLNAEEVRVFLGTIDTPQEAALLVYASNYDLDCVDNNIKSEGDGYLVYGEKGNTCGGNVRGYQIYVSADGSIEERKSRIVERGDKNCVIGRIPEGLSGPDIAHPGASPGPNFEARSVGEYLAEVAYLEAASVAAFEQLARELEELLAPIELIERAQRAAREETRHAIVMGALARRFGHERAVPCVSRLACRSAYRIALENAVEGLTRETFGALLGLHQAACASDPLVRRAFRMVAHDEAGHAEFSWELHRFLMTRLTPAERRDVERTQRVAQLDFRRHACQARYAPEVRRVLGLPGAEVASRLYDELFARIQGEV